MKQTLWLALCVSAIILAFVLSGCGSISYSGPQGDRGATGPQGPPGQIVIPPAEGADVAEVVKEENDYRASVGQEPLVSGLSCTLYTVPTTTTKIVGATLTSVGSWTYVGTFNVANQSVSTGLNVLPVALQPVYQTWYVVKCSGVIAVADDSWHNFSLTSDDGSNLYVDGLLVSNDGMHGTQTVSNVRFLKHGVHSFELDYLQGSGNEALILNLDGSLLPSSSLYH
jgi:hypothetical protein